MKKVLVVLGILVLSGFNTTEAEFKKMSIKLNMESSVQVGSNGTIELTLKNNLSKPVPDVLIRVFSLDLEIKNNKIVESFEAGETKSFTFYYNVVANYEGENKVYVYYEYDGVPSTACGIQPVLPARNLETYTIEVREVKEVKKVSEKRMNSPPTAVMTVSSNRIYSHEEEILFDASLSKDVDGNRLSFTWTSNIDGFLSSKPVFLKKLSVGNHLISLEVSDGVAKAITYIGISVVEAEESQDFLITTPLNYGLYYSDEEITFDTFLEGESYKWVSNIDGLLSNKKTFKTKLSAGTHIITLRVESEGKVREERMTLQIVDTSKEEKGLLYLIKKFMNIGYLTFSIGVFLVFASVLSIPYSQTNKNQKQERLAYLQIPERIPKNPCLNAVHCPRCGSVMKKFYVEKENSFFNIFKCYNCSLSLAE